MKLKDLFSLLKETLSEYGEDKISRLAAALAYYTIFSLAPMLVIAVAVAGFFFGQEAARGQIAAQISGLIGPDAAEMVQTMIQNAGAGSGGIIATVIGVATLLLGATTAFTQLQEALNKVWDVPKEERGEGLQGTLMKRLLAFVMVLGIAVLLLAAVVISSVLPALENFLPNLGPGTQIVLQVVNFAVSVGLFTLLFAAMFRYVPDTDVEWGDVWVGAAVTAFLFVIGQLLIGLYIGSGGVTSTFGAASSLIALLVWIYFSAQIVLIGAEFTAIYARRFGSRVGQTRETPEAAEAEQTAALQQLGPRARRGAPSVPAHHHRPAALSQSRTQRRGMSAFTGAVVAVAVGVIGFVLNALRRDVQRY